MFGERINMCRPFRLLRWPALLVSRQYMLHIEANIYVEEGLLDGMEGLLAEAGVEERGHFAQMN